MAVPHCTELHTTSAFSMFQPSSHTVPHTSSWNTSTRPEQAVKKHQQAVVSFLEANGLSFQQVDITMAEEERLWMCHHVPRDKHPAVGSPRTPQIFNGDRYCGGLLHTLSVVHWGVSAVF
ncbi:hypothetical protein CRUP_033846 [Coryphaenoides rupestris]|nr:hypothetical protein CRUP_033846 [Coryphaenoides rupestris]